MLVHLFCRSSSNTKNSMKMCTDDNNGISGSRNLGRVIYLALPLFLSNNQPGTQSERTLYTKTSSRLVEPAKILMGYFLGCFFSVLVAFIIQVKPLSITSFPTEKLPYPFAFIRLAALTFHF